MQSLKDILNKFNPTEDKYISREFQAFGAYLAEQLNDKKRISLYIKYAKHVPRSILERALQFVSDSNARNKAALFMWKLKEMGTFDKYPIPKSTRKKPAKKKTTKQP